MRNNKKLESQQLKKVTLQKLSEATGLATLVIGCSIVRWALVNTFPGILAAMRETFKIVCTVFVVGGQAVQRRLVATG